MYYRVIGDSLRMLNAHPNFFFNEENYYHYLFLK